MRKVQVIVVVLFALLQAGCRSIPVAELDEYQRAFGEVQSVSEDLLLDFDRTLRESRVRVRTFSDAWAGWLVAA